VTSDLESLFQTMARAIAECAAGATGRVLYVAECHESTIASALYIDVSGIMRMKFASDRLDEETIKFWELSRETDSKGEWRRLIFVLDGSKFAIRLLYPDEVDSDETPPDERQAALIFEHFGATEWDDSDP
jgi:hypothetical protein